MGLLPLGRSDPVDKLGGSEQAQEDLPGYNYTQGGLVGHWARWPSVLAAMSGEHPHCDSYVKGPLLLERSCQTHAFDRLPLFHEIQMRLDMNGKLQSFANNLPR